MTLDLRQILESHGVSIEELKNRIEAKGENLSRTSISNILNGKTSPKVSTLESIADALQIPVQDLFSSTRKPQSTPIFKRNIDGDFEQIGELYE